MGFFSRSKPVVGQRDPKAATSQSYIYGYGRDYPMIPDWDAERAYTWGYIANAFVYACVRAVATDVASMPFRTATDAPDDIQESREFDRNSSLAKLLGPAPGHPAPNLSARKLWSWSIAQRLITGRLGWEIERKNSEIVALWPLVSRLLKPIPSVTGNAWFTGFDYGPQGHDKRLRVEDVFYSWIPSQDDFRQAESPLQSARLPIDLAVMIERYDHAFIQNDATPATLVTHQAIDDEADRSAWREQFQNRHSGPDNAGRIAFNEVAPTEDGKVVGTVAIERLGLSQKDAEFAKRHASSIQAICVAIGVPLSRLMDASGRTFSNADAERVNYWQSTIKPLANDLAEDVNTQIAPFVGNEVGWFDMSGVSGLSPEKERGYTLISLGEGVDRGLWSPAWAAGEAGAPTEGLSNKPLVKADEAPRSKPKVNNRKRGESVLRIVDGLEPQVERQFQNLFERQAKSVTAKLDSSRGRKALAMTRAEEDGSPELFDQEFWTAETLAVMNEVYVSIANAAAVRVIEQFDVGDREKLVDAALQALNTRAIQLSGEITETTVESIRTALASGISEGEGIPQLQARVRTVFEEASKARAALIARTETMAAFNTGTLESGRELSLLGVVAGKEWLATGDSRTRPEHAAADGQKRRIDQPFNVGSALLQSPGEPNCRCTIALLTEEDMI